MDIRLEALRGRLRGTMPQDAAKLCYQSVYGCSHILRNPDAAHTYLLDEMNAAPSTEGEGIEPISETMIRLHLGGTVAREADAERVWQAMLQTAAGNPGSAEELEETLRCVADWSRHNLMPFTESEWIAFCEGWSDHSFLPLSHSESYHAEYDPHYRVLSRIALEALLKGEKP